MKHLGSKLFCIFLKSTFGLSLESAATLTCTNNSEYARQTLTKVHLAAQMKW